MGYWIVYDPPIVVIFTRGQIINKLLHIENRRDKQRLIPFRHCHFCKSQSLFLIPMQSMHEQEHLFTLFANEQRRRRAGI